jgi:hypothetical protein
VFATTLGSVAAGNTANAIDALLDGGEGGVSLENQDLTKAVGKAIAAVITLAAKSQRGKTRQSLEKIAAQAKDNWVAIAQQELTQQRYPELREAKLDQFLTPEEYQLTQQGNLTATEWGDIFIRLNMAACKGGGFPIPPEVRQQVAELLHTTFPKALRETLKEDFAQDGKAFAGLTLQLLTGMQAQLSQLQANQEGVNVEEFSQILQQFQELETQLRGSVSQQQAFFTDISGRIDSGFAEVCQRLGVMETTITELLQTLEERLVELRQEVTELRQEVRQGFESRHNQPGGRQFSKQEYRNRQNILTQMRTEVESRLTQSIHRAAFVNLGKEQQPQQVQRPWDMSVKVGEQRRVQLPPQTTILDVFDNPTISGKFLILGKPGGGKTTTLLELAEALIERAEGDSDAPIPVILELSSWQEVTKSKFLPFRKPEKYDPSIKEWILSQLISKGVSQEIGEQWLREKELVLLLDGLDELQPERQGKCVEAINQFLGGEFSPLHLLVCSRKEEYEVYEEMLHLNGAICLEDLTTEQMQHYFANVNLGEFWDSIQDSDKIINFIRQPLFLAITTIAYQQIDVEEWRNCNTEDKAADYLLGIYWIHTLDSKDSRLSNFRSQKINQNSLIRGIRRIARYLDKQKQQDFTVKGLQPEFLLEEQYLYDMKNWILLSLWCFLNLIFVILIIFSIGMSSGFQGARLAGFVAGIIISLPFPVISYLLWNVLLFRFKSDVIHLNTFSLLRLKNLFVFFSEFVSFTSDWTVVLFWMCLNFSPLIFFGYLGYTIDNNITTSFILFVVIPLCFTVFIAPIIFTHRVTSGEIHLRKEEIQKLKYSKLLLNIISIMLFWLFYFRIVYLALQFAITHLINWLPDKFNGLFSIFTLEILFILIPIYIGISVSGAYDLINHFIMRAILIKCDRNYWNLTYFFDYCTERLILQRVGNRYRFIHRLVQEHFAKLEIQKD